MGTITISLKDRIEKKFRRTAERELGKHKGYLGEALEEAISEWTEKKSKNAVSKTIALLEEGRNLGKLKFKTRDDIHDRHDR